MKTYATPHTIKTLHLLRREWQVKCQSGFDWLQPLVLFLLIATLFPLSIGAESATLLRLAVPIVWIAALLSLVVGTESLFSADFENGVLAQLVASGAPLAIWVFVRLCVHWFFSAFMVAMLSFLAMPLFNLPLFAAAILALSVLIASPTLLALSAIASSLTIGIKNASLLVALIGLPMQLPVLIFATGLVERAQMGLAFLPILAILAAMSIIAMICAPFIIAFSLKMAWQN